MLLLWCFSDGIEPRSSSVKRESKQQKTRPNSSRCSNEGVEDSLAVSALPKKEKNKGSNMTSSGAQSSNRQQSRNGKMKEQLSASGKWAWSAFQSSPDPAELPMPPFLTKTAGGFSDGDKSTSASTSAAPLSLPTLPPVQLMTAAPAPAFSLGPPSVQPPQPLLPPVPSAPPDVAAPIAPMSVELSMTQDLCRMLNIGGG